MNKYALMLLSAGMIGLGSTLVAQDEAPPKQEAKREAPGRNFGPRGGGMRMSPEVREATMKLNSLVREYDKEKDEKVLEDIKKQLETIQDLRIKAAEEQLKELKDKKDETVNKTFESIKSGEFQKQFQNRRGPGGPRGGQQRGGQRPAQQPPAK